MIRETPALPGGDALAGPLRFSLMEFVPHCWAACQANSLHHFVTIQPGQACSWMINALILFALPAEA